MLFLGERLYIIRRKYVKKYSYCSVWRDREVDSLTTHPVVGQPDLATVYKAKLSSKEDTDGSLWYLCRCLSEPHLLQTYNLDSSYLSGR